MNISCLTTCVQKYEIKPTLECHIISNTFKVTPYTQISTKNEINAHCLWCDHCGSGKR